jgi:ubiquinone/menaquinone biosynthesis C-methylase UbiE
MRHGRRAYYDAFSKFYDRFVALHSGDKQGLARQFLADQIPFGGAPASVLDLCTGTGSTLPHIQSKVGTTGATVGVDFSHGMLKAAMGKIPASENIYLVEGNAGALPFPSHTFDAVTCSHAFYELKGETQREALEEIVRVLKPEGVFLMMEHDVPYNRFIRALFYTRLTLIGSGRAITFLQQEQKVLEQHFRTVEKLVAPAGRSKIMRCRK